jgi:hypothetical protein
VTHVVFLADLLFVIKQTKERHKASPSAELKRSLLAYGVSPDAIGNGELFNKMKECVRSYKEAGGDVDLIGGGDEAASAGGGGEGGARPPWPAATDSHLPRILERLVKEHRSHSDDSSTKVALPHAFKHRHSIDRLSQPCCLVYVCVMHVYM